VAGITTRGEFSRPWLVLLEASSGWLVPGIVPSGVHPIITVSKEQARIKLGTRIKTSK
jgi:hypothetical protein